MSRRDSVAELVSLRRPLLDELLRDSGIWAERVEEFAVVDRVGDGRGRLSFEEAGDTLVDR